MYFCAMAKTKKNVEIIKPFEGFQEKFVTSNVDFVIGGSAVGVGKQHPITEPILTPNGWVKIGDLKIGDYVCTPFSKDTRIVNIFPQGVKDVYTIKTSDGRKCEAGLEHLWAVRNEDQLKYIGNATCAKHVNITTTKEIIKLLDENKEVLLPINSAIEFKYKENFGRILNDDYNPMFIGGTIKQRKQLIYSLMSSFGNTIERNEYLLSLDSSILVNKCVAICRSLGYIVYKLDEFNLKITTNDDLFLEFKKGYKSKKKYYNHIKITSVEKTGVMESVCIMLDDADHLYICNDYIVTHNTFAAALLCAEPFVSDGKFRALYLRNNIADLKAAGGLLDKFKDIYGNSLDIVESKDQSITYKDTGARVELTHIADQNKKKIQTRFDGREYDLIYFDEGTGFTWETFCYLLTRNRGATKYAGKVRMTTNPRLSHWTRIFVDWYIASDGYPIPERDGVVRYFFNSGEDVNEVVWGDSKEDVYEKCKFQIDKILKQANGKKGTATYKNVIKSFTLLSGSMYDNKSMTDTNPDYIGSVAAVGGREATVRFGNWNVDPDIDENAPIHPMSAKSCSTNDPMINSEKWITADIADYGTDNVVILVWQGLHVIDKLVLCRTDPKQNADNILMMAEKYQIANNHIIYDATNARYIQIHIPEAIPFISANSSIGIYKRMAHRLKDECYLRLVYLINHASITISDEVWNSKYPHIRGKKDGQDIVENILTSVEFLEECRVVRFYDMPSGAKRLFTKKEMNRQLGNGRSMDLLDPFAMRMLPLLKYEYGREFEMSTQAYQYEDLDDDSNGETVYDVLGD